MKVLLIAYKIEFNKGSEDAIGYHLVAALAKQLTFLTLLTQQKNIDKLRNDQLFSHVKFIAVDLPWKKRLGVGLYYYFWQMRVGQVISQMQKTEFFDVIHQVNFGISWIPHFIRKRPKQKLIWGPLMNHDPIPFDYWHGTVTSFLLGEGGKNLLKKLFWWCDPFLWRARLASDVVLWGSDKIPLSYRLCQNVQILIPAGSRFPTIAGKVGDQIFTILYVGRLIDLKGCMLAIDAVIRFISELEPAQQKIVMFKMIGRGPLADMLTTRIKQINEHTQARAILEDWKAQEELQQAYDEADLFLFPSVEGQGVVVAEALARGCPILCLEGTGPNFIAGRAGIAVKKQSYHTSCENLARTLKDLANAYSNQDYERFIQAAISRSHELEWDKKAEKIIEAYRG